MFIFSDFNSISKAEISELIETKTKMMGTEIELIKAKTELLEAKTKLLETKCLSEAEIIQLIKSNTELGKIGSGKIKKPRKPRLKKQKSWVEKEREYLKRESKKKSELKRLERLVSQGILPRLIRVK